MTLFNRNWIGFAGDPLTGKTPTQTLVHADAGVVLSGQQQGAVAHAYKLFCDAITVSSVPGGYHVQDRTLVDGTKVRMTSIAGVHQVHVWPAGGDGGRIYRGFVVIPLNANAPEPAGGAKPKLVWLDKDEVWFDPHHQFNPRDGATYIPYFVDSRRSAPYTESDDKYHDVYAALGPRIFKNGVPMRGLGAPAPGVPVPTTNDGKDFLLVTDTTVARPDPTAPTTPYTFSSHYAPIIPGTGFGAGHYLRSLGAGKSASYLGFNVTPMYLLEVWAAKVALHNTPPYAAPAEAYAYLPGPGEMQDFSGLTYAAVTPPSAPIFPAVTPIIGYVYQPVGHTVPASGSFSEYWQADGPSTVIGPLTAAGLGSNGTGGAELRTYNKTFTALNTVALGDQATITVDRRVTVASTQTRNVAVGYGGIHPSSGHNGSGGIPFGYPYIFQPQTFYGGAVAAGQVSPYGGQHIETGGVLTHTDVSSCTIALDRADAGGSADIYKVNVSRAHNEQSGWAQVFDGSVMVHGPTTPYTAWGDHGQLLVMYGTDLPFTITNYSEKVVTHTVTGVARDYIYDDPANLCSIWVETTVSSTASAEHTNTGSSTVRIEIVAEMKPYRSNRKTIYLKEKSEPLSFALGKPAGIEWPINVIRFQYHYIKQPVPIYAPIWRGQGGCPFVAYTTAGENTHYPNPPSREKLLIDLRLQLLRTERGFLPDPPSLEDVVGFRPYMGEQLLKHYGAELALIFSSFEAAATTFFYGDALSAALGEPADRETKFGNYYRT